MLTLALTKPNMLPWWAWCKLLGWPLLGLALLSSHPLALGLVLHWFVDFTCQSPSTATGKGKCDRYTLVYHSFLSGGYAGIVAGGLFGLAISFAVHYLIDWLVKPNLGDSPFSRTLDQALHIATVVAIWALC